MSFFTNDPSHVVGSQGHQATPPSSLPVHEYDKIARREIESLPFGYQFAEVDNAISNFTKHQPFKHHYAPNVHVNRSHNHHHNNNNRHHNHSNGNNNNHNNSNNNNNNFKNRFQQPGNFAMNAKLKQQQQQQFVLAHANPQQIARLKHFSTAGPMNHSQLSMVQHQQSHQQMPPIHSQQQQQQQQQQQLNSFANQQVNQTLNGYGEVNEFNYDSFQHQTAQPGLNHSGLINGLRNGPASPQNLSTVGRQNTISPFPVPLNQVSSTGSSFGMNSDLVNAPLTPTSSSDFIENKLSLDEDSYLGDIWGNNKYSKSSASVWA